MNDDDLDRTTRAVLDPSPMTAAERDSAWSDLLRRLEPPARPRRRWRMLLVPATAAVAATTVIALVPGGTDAPLSSASAATVLLAAADEADLGAPGPGQELFVRERRTIPMDDGQSDDVIVTRSWTRADGTGRREVGGRAEPFPEDYAASWHGTFTGAQVAALPADPPALLAELRAAVTRAAEDDRALRVYGRDLGVIATIAYLSTDAPVTSEQRAALLELLATAPEWTVPGSSVTPIATRNLGAARSADGRQAVRIRVELRFTAEEARSLSIDPEPFAIDLLVDTDAGRLVELREYEDGLSGDPIVTTIEVQRITDAKAS